MLDLYLIHVFYNLMRLQWRFESHIFNPAFFVAPHLIDIEEPNLIFCGDPRDDVSDSVHEYIQCVAWKHLGFNPYPHEQYRHQHKISGHAALFLSWTFDPTKDVLKIE